MQYSIGLATFIGFKILSNIGFWNIGKFSHQCNTSKVSISMKLGPMFLSETRDIITAR